MMISCLGTLGLASVAPCGPQTSRNSALEVAPTNTRKPEVRRNLPLGERGFHPTQERITYSTDPHETLHKSLLECLRKLLRGYFTFLSVTPVRDLPKYATLVVDEIARSVAHLGLPPKILSGNFQVFSLETI